VSTQHETAFVRYSTYWVAHESLHQLSPVPWEFSHDPKQANLRWAASNEALHSAGKPGGWERSIAISNVVHRPLNLAAAHVLDGILSGESAAGQEMVKCLVTVGGTNPAMHMQGTLAGGYTDSPFPRVATALLCLRSRPRRDWGWTPPHINQLGIRALSSPNISRC
jgi:hypothetical protein